MDKRPFGDGTPAKVPWMPQSHVIAWLAFAALMNLILFVGELIPATVGKLTTDGGHLLNWIRGDHSAERPLLILSLWEISKNGVRPRDWEGSLLERILAASDG